MYDSTRPSLSYGGIVVDLVGICTLWVRVRNMSPNNAAPMSERQTGAAMLRQLLLQTRIPVQLIDTGAW